MALTYCEVCGVLIRGQGAQVPEGVICADCFGSRQVMVDSDELIRAEPVQDLPVAAPEKIQFGCPYCDAVLRLAVPHGERLHVRCPRCTETFYAESDGRVAARMEGNTTQVLMQEEVLPDLTPGQGSQSLKSPGTQPLKPLRNDSTRPLSPLRSDATRPLSPLRSDQTRPLVPLRGSEGQGSFPQLRPSGAGAGGLDLVPTGQDSPAGKAELRASDEGRLSLDAAALRAKTKRFQGPDGKGRRTTSKKRRADEPEAAPAEEPAAEEAPAKRKGKIPKGKKASERFSKVSSGAIKRSVARAEELQQEQERRLLAAGAAWALLLVPALLCAFLAILSSRDAGLVQEGKPVGRFLRTSGDQADRAVRAVNELLPPAARLPGLSPERPVAPVSSQSR